MNKNDLEAMTGLYAGKLAGFYGDDIKKLIDSGEITIDEIGTIFTECLRFALS